MCTRLFMLARCAVDDPFHVRYIVPLGGGGSFASCDWLYTAHSDEYWFDVGSGLPSMKLP